MTSAEVEASVRVVWEQFAPPILEALERVEVIICERADEQPDAPADWNGRYIGTQLVSDEEQGEVVSLPEGKLYLCAPNLKGAQDAHNVFLHEIGHALGLDEAEVADLGLE